MKKIIAIVAGGDSSEHDVSMRSAGGILSFLDKSLFRPYIIEIKGARWEALTDENRRASVDRNDFSFLDGGARVHPDFAYVTIHGTPGENGILQGYFDMLRLPYSTSGVLTEALTFNKFALINYLKSFGVKAADSLLIDRRHVGLIKPADVLNRVGLPCFVKPNEGGSSFGITKVKKESELLPAVQKALREGCAAMAETFLKGREVTVGCYKTRTKEVVFPVTEVVTNNEFFDYDAKYNGQVTEITPAPLSATLAQRLKALTSAIYDILNCSGIIRADYILTPAHDGPEHAAINLLEVNTTPGMTATSFIPQQARAAGMEMKDVLNDVILDKLN